MTSVQSPHNDLTPLRILEDSPWDSHSSSTRHWTSSLIRSSMLCLATPKFLMAFRENRRRTFHDFPLEKATPDWKGTKGRIIILTGPRRCIILPTLQTLRSGEILYSVPEYLYNTQYLIWRNQTYSYLSYWNTISGSWKSNNWSQRVTLCLKDQVRPVFRSFGI